MMNYDKLNDKFFTVYRQFLHMSHFTESRFLAGKLLTLYGHFYSPSRTYPQWVAELLDNDRQMQCLFNDSVHSDTNFVRYILFEWTTLPDTRNQIMGNNPCAKYGEWIPIYRELLVWLLEESVSGCQKAVLV